MSPDNPALRAIAGFGLLDAPPYEPTAEECAALRWDLQVERLNGLAVLALDAGALVVDAGTAEGLRADDRLWAWHTLRAEETMLETVDALSGPGIATRILKGAALADCAWSLPHARRWADADVLVHPGDVDAAVRALEAGGARRLLPELRPGFDRRLAKSVTMRNAHDVEIDVHRTLLYGPHTFLIPEADLWDDPQHFDVEGRRLATLSPTATFVHTCLHATIAGAKPLGAVRDVVEASAHADLDAAARLAARWRATLAVRLAADDAVARLGLPADHPLPAWARTLPVPDRDRRLYEVYREGQRTNRRLALRTLAVVPGIVDKARFAWAMVAPSPENRGSRGRERTDQLRRIFRE